MRLSDVKMEGKSLGKGGIELGSIFSSETDVKERVFIVLTKPITRGGRS